MATEQAKEAEQVTTSTEDAVEGANEPETTTEATEEGKPDTETTSEEAGDDKLADDQPKGITVVLDDPEEPPPPADQPGANKRWAEMRTKARAAEQRAAEAEAKLAALARPAIPAAPVLPPRPKGSDPEIDHEEGKLATAMEAWVEKKRQYDEHQAKAKVEAQQQQKEWADVESSYIEKEKAVIGIADFQAAKQLVRDTFTVAQQSIMMDVLDNAPVAVLALGRNPAKAKELAAMKNLPRFTKALVQMENTMTVTSPKKPKAAPEKRITGGGSSAPDSTLETLRAKAQETGDYTEVNRHKNKVKEAQQKKK